MEFIDPKIEMEEDLIFSEIMNELVLDVEKRSHGFDAKDDCKTELDYSGVDNTPPPILSEENGVSSLIPVEEAPDNVEEEQNDTGVEENVASRFIDYSFATPFENFIADLDGYLRLWKKNQSLSSSEPSYVKELTYDDASFILLYFSTKRSSLGANSLNRNVAQNIAKIGRDLSRCYDEQVLVLLAPLSSVSTDSSYTYKSPVNPKLVQSALAIALGTAGFYVPAFYYSSVKKFRQVSIIPASSGYGLRKRGSSNAETKEQPMEDLKPVVTSVGYCVRPLRHMDAEPDENQDMSDIAEVDNCDRIITHYETQMFSNMTGEPHNGSNASRVVAFDGSVFTPRHELYYYEGLLKYFKDRVKEYSNGSVDVKIDCHDVDQEDEYNHTGYANDTRYPYDIVEPYSVQITETYSLYDRTQVNGGNTTRSHYLKRLLLLYGKTMNAHMRDLAFTNTAFASDFQSDTQSVRGVLESAVLNNISLLSDTYMKPLTRNLKTKPQSSPRWIRGISVTVKYSYNHDSNAWAGSQKIIDNEFYCNLVPSRQPPSSWFVSAQLYQPQGSSNADKINTIAVAPSPLSAGIRRLLAFYILGKISRQSTFSSSLEPLKIDDVHNICASLSPETQAVVLEYCNQAISEENAQMNKNSANAPPASPLRSPSGKGTVRERFARWRTESSSGVSRSKELDWMNLSLFDDVLDPVNNTTDATCSIVDELMTKLQNRVCESVKELNSAKSGQTDHAQHVPMLAPAFHFTNLFSLLMSTCTSYSQMAQCWHQIVLDTIRSNYWDQGKTIPNMMATDSKVQQEKFPECFDHFMKQTAPYSNLSEIFGFSGPLDPRLDGVKSAQTAYVSSLLWDDLLKKHQSDGAGVCLPDLSQSLICQKFQMLQLCIACRGDEMFYKTKPVAGSKRYVDRDSDDDSDEEFYDASDVKPMAAPSLLRRIPYTTDKLARYLYMLANSRTAGISASGDIDAGSSLIGFSVRAPHVVSDIRSFKGENWKKPGSARLSQKVGQYDAEFEKFYAWYFGKDFQSSNKPESMSQLDRHIRKVLYSIWGQIDYSAQRKRGKNSEEVGSNSNVSCRANDQKPLLRLEAEGEKVLRFLSEIRPATLAIESLCSAISLAFVILSAQQIEMHIKSKQTDEVEEMLMKGNYFPADSIASSLLQLLLDNIAEVIPLLRNDEDDAHQLFCVKRSSTNNAFFKRTDSWTAEVNKELQGSSGVDGNEFNTTNIDDLNVSDGRDCAINPQILILLDCICSTIDNIVNYGEKQRELSELLPNSPRLTELLSCAGIKFHRESKNMENISSEDDYQQYGFAAISDAEASNLYSIARVISLENFKHSQSLSQLGNQATPGSIANQPSSDMHVWHSINGKELDYPNTRSIKIEYFTNGCSDASCSYLYPQESGAEYDANNGFGVFSPGSSGVVPLTSLGMTPPTSRDICQGIKSFYHNRYDAVSSDTNDISFEEEVLESIGNNKNSDTLKICFKYSEVEM